MNTIHSMGDQLVELVLAKFDLKPESDAKDGELIDATRTEFGKAARAMGKSVVKTLMPGGAGQHI